MGDRLSELFGESGCYCFLKKVCGLLLKVMVVLYCWVGFLFESLLIVFQKICVFCLWSHCLLSLSFHSFDLCVLISFVIWSVSVLMFGFVCLSLVLIFVSMSFGMIW